MKSIEYDRPYVKLNGGTEPKLLYLHGKDEETKYPGGGVIYKTLSKYFNIDLAEISSIPEQGLEDFNNIDLSQYDLLVGFSMGGVYSSIQDKIPMVLINPGYGLSRLWPKFKTLDNLSLKVKKDLVNCIMVGDNDKFKKGYVPEIEKRGLSDKIHNFPSKHIPTENEIKEYIIPEIEKFV